MKIIVKVDGIRLESELENDDWSCDGCYFKEHPGHFLAQGYCQMAGVCTKYDFIFKEMG